MRIELQFETDQDWISAIQTSLKADYGEFSRAQVRDWVKSGRVWTNQRPVRLNTPVHGGWVEIRVKELVARPPEPQILWRDEHLIAVHKPAGLLSHPGAVPGQANLVDWLRQQGEFEQLVMQHRLDKETSGLLLFSHSAAACAPLAQIIAEHRWQKTYLARVQGQPPAQGRIDLPLTAVSGRVRVDKRAGKPAVTEFRRVAPGLLELRPQHGRKHQLRVHLANQGWPIVGDSLYGGTPDRRLWLHAWKLQLPHPITDEPLELEAKPEEGWGRL